MSESTAVPGVPGYERFERIGSGGFSTVYRAYDDRFDRDVAIKLLNVAMSEPSAQRRFLRECRIMGRLGSHPNIVTVFDAGVLADDRPFIVMEFLEGGTLADRAPMPQDEVLRLGVLVGSALAAVHTAEVVHRDVKPHNVFLSGFGVPVLGDFGVSAIVDQGGAVSNPMALSPLYAAPEAFHGLAGAPSDQYSLGATLYALLVNRSPVEGDADDLLPRIMARVLEDEPEPLTEAVADPALWSAISRCLAKDPERRFPAVTDLVAALQDVQRSRGGPVTAAIAPPSEAVRARPLGAAARPETRPPLGGARPAPDDERAAVSEADADATARAPWPAPLGASGVPETPAPTVTPPPEAPTRDLDEVDRSTGADGPDRPATAPTSTDGTTTDRDGGDHPDRRRRRGPSPATVLLLVVLAAVAVLVVAILRAPSDERLVRAQPTAARLEPTGDLPDDPTAPTAHELTWDGVDGETWYVVRYSESAIGTAVVEAEGVAERRLEVEIEGSDGTCFFVGSEADRERLRGQGLPLRGAEFRDPDACTPDTSIAVVTGT